MTIEDLFATIQKAGLVPVLVNREGDAEEVLNYFDGPLNQFLITAKAIGAVAVFVMAHPLEEEQFLYSLSEDEDEDEETECIAKDEVDLSTLMPALAKYKKRLGDIYSFFLVAKGGAADLCLIHDQEWLADFENEIERAQGKALFERGRPTGGNQTFP